MSVMQSRHEFATNEKLDDLEQVECEQPSGSQTPLESGPPDGGFQAWSTVFGCFLMQFCGFG
ncbi:hypothetical protein AZE42_07780 [Rhizopogon vesiculosus]|uniref:Uncharacterized protein n=1 Tax=Rhizopogon vesiculosus TaxID=180088 RepID=A0A1J8R1X6_9AGAM|nr:hypothetical protein AZE42_07780 [Rhizopogon vesiculosus]